MLSFCQASWISWLKIIPYDISDKVLENTPLPYLFGFLSCLGFVVNMLGTVPEGCFFLSYKQFYWQPFCLAASPATASLSSVPRSAPVWEALTPVWEHLPLDMAVALPLELGTEYSNPKLQPAIPEVSVHIEENGKVHSVG